MESSTLASVTLGPRAVGLDALLGIHERLHSIALAHVGSTVRTGAGTHVKASQDEHVTYGNEKHSISAADLSTLGSGHGSGHRSHLRFE